ncbi:YtxH domain-containing protein [Hymenobacter saemangeumensis]
MKDDKGKVIFSLLAGATAGIVAGLLLAPETGEETRAGLRRSASKWGGDLSKLVKDNLGKLQGLASSTGHTNEYSEVMEHKNAADRLLLGLNNTSVYDPMNEGQKPESSDSVH